MSTGSRNVFSDRSMAGTLFQMAQITKGLPWLFPRSLANLPYLNDTRATSYAMNILHFSSDNLTMMELRDNTVSFTYKFQDFQGTTPVPTKQQALLKTHCQALDTVEDQQTPGLQVNVFPDMLVPGLRTSNFSEYERNHFRWIFKMRIDPPFTSISPNETIEMCTSCIGNSRAPVQP